MSLTAAPVSFDTPLRLTQRLGEYALRPDYYVAEAEYRQLGSVDAVAYTAEQVDTAVAAMSARFAGVLQAAVKEGPEKIVLVGLRNGCQPFLVDVCSILKDALPAADQPPVVEIYAPSYNAENQKSGNVTLQFPEGVNAAEYFRGKRVYVVDDIIDTGRAMEEVSAQLKQLGAEAVEFVVMLQRFTDDHYRARSIEVPPFKAICHEAVVRAAMSGVTAQNPSEFERQVEAQVGAWFIGKGLDNQNNHEYRRSRELYYTS